MTTDLAESMIVATEFKIPTTFNQHFINWAEIFHGDHDKTFVNDHELSACDIYEVLQSDRTAPDFKDKLLIAVAETDDEWEDSFSNYLKAHNYQPWKQN